MPGKTSQGNKKYDSSRDRLNSANTSEGSSKKISIWPEWTEAELATEKWDLGGGGKGRDKGKGAHTAVVYDDPDGVLLPLSLADPNAVVWKRPNDESISDALNKSAPIIVSNPDSSLLDLYSSNKHLFHSQLMCWIVGQLNALWQMRHSLSVDAGGVVEGEKEGSLAWRPWEHIQPHPKGVSAPQINLSGKYCVRIYWMGCWRKVTIDDKLPFHEKCVSSVSMVGSVRIGEGDCGEERKVFELVPLYPRTLVLAELWPALLMKAILKVVALDYTEGCPEDEFGDSSVIHMLTGWTPLTIPLKPSLSSFETWDTLCKLLPLWKRPEHEEDVGGATPEEEDTSLNTPPPPATPLRNNYIVIGSFGSCYPSPAHRPPTATALQEISKSEAILKKFHVIPAEYNLHTQPSYPVLLTQFRDQLLVPPPKEPPLPELQAPYYLGLKNREKHPGLATPPPTPPNAEPRFLELYPTVYDEAEVRDLATTPEPSGLGSNLRTENIAKANSDTVSPKPIMEKSVKSADKPLKAASDIGPPRTLSVNKAKSGRERRSKRSAIIRMEQKIFTTWMDYLDFLSVFKRIHVFQSPHKFKHRESYFELPKTSGTSTRAATASSSKKGVSNSLLSSSVKSAAAKDNNCMFVDCAEPIDLLFVFSSLSNWREGGRDTHRCHLSAPINTHLSNRFSQNRPSISVSVVSDLHPMTPSSTPDTLEVSTGAGRGDDTLPSEGGEVRRGRNKILCGSLVVETCSWSSAQFGEPVLQVSTTGVKGAMFSLPPGRHVFKLHVRVPIGHHLEIFSNSPFTLTSEDSLFTYLSQDCSRLVSYSTEIVKNFLFSYKIIGNSELLKTSLQPLIEMLSKYGITSGYSKLLLSSALYSWATQAKDCELTDKMQVAWKAFLIKVCSIIEDKLPPGPCPVDSEVATLRNQLKVYYKSNVKTEELEKIPDIPESWADREPTEDEEEAAKTITSSLRLYARARLEDSMQPGSQANQDTMEVLTQSVPLLEPNVQKLGTTMLYGMFKLDPSLPEKFPFYEDFNSQAYSTLYCGSFPPIQPNSWTIILRKTLHITEPQIIALYFNCPLPSSILRVIDNDSMTEMPRVFQVTVPQVYQPNQKGYTLQAEAWVCGSPTAPPSEDTEEKKWKLRIVTSNRDRPPVMEQVTVDEGGVVVISDGFHKQEMVNYCLPDREEVLFRYLLMPVKESAVSLQVTTSKQDALIKFEVLDNENTVTSVEGRGVCTIPLCFLQPVEDISLDCENSVEDPDQTSHKYVVQARILRKSWPMAETAWPHIAALQRAEERERQSSGQKPGSGKKTKPSKDRRKTAGTIAPTNITVQPQIETSKPHWMLRVVTKEEDTVEVKKDTERADKLKSMVQAWEAEQPGRCKAAQESRQKFLDKRAIRDEVGNEELEVSSTSTVDGMPSVPRPNTGPVRIWQMDLTPFIIKESDTPILLDEAEQARRLAERQRIFKEYRASRQAVLDLRNEDRQRRNEAKVKQLEMAEQWQMELDALRKKLNTVREAVREKHLAKERAELEKIKALEDNQSAVSGRDSKTGKAKGGKKKK